MMSLISRQSVTRLMKFGAGALLFCIVTGFDIDRAAAIERVDKIDLFLKQVQSNASLTNEQRSAVVEAVNELRGDEYGRDQAISTGLMIIYPEYEEAILGSDEAGSEGQLDLAKLTQSDDKFLAADAGFYLARVLMSTQRHEDALQLLERITGELAEFTMHSGNALYFTAVAQANLLDYQKAVNTFERFLAENPQAPERLRVSAWRQLEMLSAIEEGSLSDVFQRMDYSRRRLELEQTDDVTQVQQDKIVKLLQTLIKEEEKKECSSCSSNCDSQEQGERPQNAQAQNPGQGKSNRGGESNQENGVVRRSYDNGPASPWSRLRDRSRDAANNAIKEKLPARYRTVVEKYNEKVNETDGPNK